MKKVPLALVLSEQPRNGWSPPAEYQTGTGVPVLTLSSVTGFEYDGTKTKLTSAPLKDVAHYWLQEGELLITRSNTEDLVGHVAVYDGFPAQAICCDLIMKMKVDSAKALTRYIYYFLRSPESRTYLSSRAQGASPTMKKIGKQVVQNIPVPVPPLPEQQRIVGILDEAFEGIATATANAEKNLHNARALFESYFDSAVTGKLTQEWRRKHGNTENASAGLAVRLAERRKQWTGTGKYREPDSPIVLKPIDIPKGWVLASPEQITTHIVDCPHSTPKWAESGVLCLRTTNFKPGFLDLESVRFVSQQTYKERIMRLEPKPGDVLYSREGGILGVACMIPAQLKTCLGQRMMLFRTDPALVLPEFFTAVLNSTLVLSEVIRLTSGAASPHLNIFDIRTFPIPLPPITEQRQIVSKLDAITTETQRLESIYQQKLAALDELKKSLLHQAFSGEL